MTGWTRLLRLALRRDRVLVPVWVVALALICVASVQATVDLYPTRAARLEAGRGVNDNPALVAFYGPIADPGSVGGIATFKLLLLGGAFVAMLAVIVVRRHTRLEEESGRAELLVATGRHAFLAAALVESVLASALVAVVTVLGCVAAGLDAGATVGFGAAWFGLGLAAAGIAALAAQLAASTRTVGAVAAALLGATYLLRAVGDVARADGWGWLTWLSPFGWVSRMRLYGDERWWVMVLPLGLFVVCATAASALVSRRDVGQGLVAERPGPATGRLRTVAGLTWRLQRLSVLGWTIVVAAVGAVLGAIVPSVRSFADSQGVREMLARVGGEGRLTDTFIATEIAFVAVGLAAMAVAAVVRLAGEEDAGRVAVLLATATSRGRLLATTALVVVGWPSLAALAFGATTSLTTGRQLVGATLAQLPAVWLVGALALLLLAVRRSWAVLGWAFLGLFLLLGQVGDLLDLPQWLLSLSPFEHVPQMPTEAFRLGPELVLTLVAVALGATALWRYREREVAG